MAERALTRRERYREQTLAEIKSSALRQIAEGGVEALSLNAIAKEMGMSGPAVYRYFASRDDLLAELVVDGYEALADALEAAVGDGSPERRLRRIAGAYRDWALAQPNHYRLLFGTRIGSGELAPERVVPAAQRSMDVFLDALAGLPSLPGPPARLSAQLEAWGGSTYPAAVLRRGIACWTRLHGLLALELEGHFASMNVDPALLYRAEVDDLIG
jgi:AcrR family transcriptional regulator